MKKILSFALSLILVCSMLVIPTFAAETDYSNGTTIKLVGTYGEASYTVTVPAELSPGESGTVTASGAWSSEQTLKVTAPDSVTLSYGEKTMDVGIEFPGIEKSGSDTETVTATATVAVADTSVLFGTWTGTLNYTIELVKNNLISFTINNTTYQAEAGMTWYEWANSNYNKDKYTLGMENIWCPCYGAAVTDAYGEYVSNNAEIEATNYIYSCSTCNPDNNLIRFTINDVEYQAEDGMTWTEWLSIGTNKENTHLMIYSGDGTVCVNAAYDKGYDVAGTKLSINNENVYAYDQIISGGVYTT